MFDKGSKIASAIVVMRDRDPEEMAAYIWRPARRTFAMKEPEFIYSYTPFYYDIHTILLPIYTPILLPIYTLFAKYTHLFCLIYTLDIYI
jgi:hypothetical protein